MKYETQEIPSSAPPTAPQPSAPTAACAETAPNAAPNASLWAAARAALDIMSALFGAPVIIACLKFLIPARHADMLAWLRPIEQLLRKLIYLEARELTLPHRSPPSPTPAAPAPPPVSAAIALDPAQSESWPAHFHLARQSRPAPQDSGQSAPASMPAPKHDARAGLHGAFAIAERWEAALRVVENPGPCVRRLAWRLRAAPTLARRFLRALAPPPDNGRHGPCAWALEEAWLRAAAPAPDTS